MGRRAARRRHAATTAALAATLTALLAAGCTASPHRPADDGRGGNPTPGQAAGPVLAVKIDNVGAARPQTGLEAADVVYAEQVEGGLSRLMAVYASELPETVGPVRSARESDLELLRQFDRPTLAFSGAQSKLLPLIDKAPLSPRTPDQAPGAYYRAAGRAAPHNLYLRPHELMSAPPGPAALTTGFHYGAAPAGGHPVTARSVRYPMARFTFTWSPERGRWLIAMDGTAARSADGTRLAAATVVVQYVRVRGSDYHDVLGNNTPFTETVGSGKAEVLRDGKAFEATWKRPTASDGTDFTNTDGVPVNFAKGQVWVVFAPAAD